MAEANAGMPGWTTRPLTTRQREKKLKLGKQHFINQKYGKQKIEITKPDTNFTNILKKLKLGKQKADMRNY